MNLATRSERFFAHVVDGVISGLIYGALYFSSYFIFGLGFLSGGAATLVAWGYFLTADAWPLWNGKSLGKHLLRIRVVDAVTRAPITQNYWKAAVRKFLFFIPLIGFIDGLMIFRSDLRRGGDLLADTIVIQD